MCDPTEWSAGWAGSRSPSLLESLGSLGAVLGLGLVLAERLGAITGMGIHPPKTPRTRPKIRRVRGKHEHNTHDKVLYRARSSPPSSPLFFPFPRPYRPSCLTQLPTSSLSYARILLAAPRPSSLSHPLVPRLRAAFLHLPPFELSPDPGPWCAAAPLWGNPASSSTAFPSSTASLPSPPFPASPRSALLRN